MAQLLHRVRANAEIDADGKIVFGEPIDGFTLPEEWIQGVFTLGPQTYLLEGPDNRYEIGILNVETDRSSVDYQRNTYYPGVGFRSILESNIEGGKFANNSGDLVFSVPLLGINVWATGLSANNSFTLPRAYNRSLAAGIGAEVYEVDDGVAIGVFSRVNVPKGIAIGMESKVDSYAANQAARTGANIEDGPTAIGYYARAGHLGATAIGSRASAYARSSTSIGFESYTGSVGGVAIGMGANASFPFEINLGGKPLMDLAWLPLVWLGNVSDGIKEFAPVGRNELDMYYFASPGLTKVTGTLVVSEPPAENTAPAIRVSEINYLVRLTTQDGMPIVTILGQPSVTETYADVAAPAITFAVDEYGKPRMSTNSENLINAWFTVKRETVPIYTPVPDLIAGVQMLEAPFGSGGRVES